MTTKKYTAAELIELEEKYGAHNYHPLPVVLEKGEGVFVWDVNGKRYFVCDPTYSNAAIGTVMPKFVNAKYEIVKIN